MAPHDARALIDLPRIETDEDAGRLAAFAAECVSVRERAALSELLTSVCNRGIPISVSELLAGGTHCGRHRGCTDPRAARPKSRKVTAALDRRLLEHPVVAKADVGIMDVAASEWSGHSLLVLKGAVRPPRGIVRDALGP